MMEIVNAEVKRFLEVPENILYSVASYVQTEDVDLASIENFMNQAIANGQTSIDLLYYTSEVPYKDGGIAAFHNHWTPPEDFDQTTRVWFKDAKKRLFLHHNGALC